MKPSALDRSAVNEAAIRENAARWVVRCDRQLTEAETVELENWLAADPRHAAALSQSAAMWRTCREIGASARRIPLEASKRHLAWNWPALGGLAAALLLGFMAYDRALPSRSAPVAASTPVTRAATTRQFPDGSVARLRGDAVIVELFSPAERRIRLVRGEAFFTVAKDVARPFSVEAGKMTVRAVGTAFAVRHEADATEVLVTEGTVQVTPPAPSLRDEPDQAVAPVLLDAGYRAVLAHSQPTRVPAIVVNAVSAAGIAQSLAWSAPMLELADAPLGELVAKFAERSGQIIEIADPALAAVRIGGRFPTDDVDGFLRALEELYQVRAVRRPDGAIILRKAE